MKIQQIRNATLKINYNDLNILVDPWLQDKGTGMSAKTINTSMIGVKSPLNELSMCIDDILKDVDFCLVTHLHPDHFTKEYLPINIKILCQNTQDMKKIKEMGFVNVKSFNDKQESIFIGKTNIIKTKCMHGENEKVASIMGTTSGYILLGDEKSIYIVGDTVLCDDVINNIKIHSPDYIILNCCAATIPEGRLIMNLEELNEISKLAPNSTIVASHLDSVNHALITSEDVKKYIQEYNLKNVIVPNCGDFIK